MSGRGLKPIAARLLFHSGLVSLKRTLGPRNRALILMYHRVNDAEDPFFPALPVGAFTRQLDYLKKHYRIEPLESVMEWVDAGGNDGPRMALTIDDGFPDTYEHVLPELARRDLSATLFLATSPPESGRPLWTERVRFALKYATVEELTIRALNLEAHRLTDTKSRLAALKVVLRRLKRQPAEVIDEVVERIESDLAPDAAPRPVLTWDQVRAMTRSGHIRVGAHTHTHYILSHLGDSLLEKEIATSVELIESRLETRVETFCYPNGRPEDYDARSEAILRKLGIRYAFDATSSPVRRGENPYRIPRLYTSERNLALFAARVAGFSTSRPVTLPAAAPKSLASAQR